jgi:hypothetical protein
VLSPANVIAIAAGAAGATFAAASVGRSNVHSEMRAEREIVWGLYWGFVANIAACAVLNNPSKASAPAWLVTLGAVNEIVGVLFIASPEIGRVLPGFFASVRRRVALVVQRIRGYFARPRHVIIAADSARGTAEMGTPTIVMTPGASASIDERLDYLMRRDKEIRSHLHRVDRDLERLPTQWRAELEGVRTELETLQRELVRSIAEARIRLRLLGLSFVLVGIVLSWLGNVL